MCCKIDKTISDEGILTSYVAEGTMQNHATRVHNQDIGLLRETLIYDTANVVKTMQHHSPQFRNEYGPSLYLSKHRMFRTS
jgi:hypothetical protein